MPSPSSRKTRLLGLGLIGALACAASLTPSLTACSPKKGGLMLAINTDMRAPKDVNVITLSVLVNNQVKVNYQGRVTPDGKVLLPATVALTEPEDPNASVRIRVVAFQERKARVLRDVRTTIPKEGRVALLRLPLNFINDGSGTGELPVGMVIDDKPISTVAPGGGGGSSSGDVDGGTSSGGPSDAGESSGGPDLGGTFGSGEFNPYEIVFSACPVDQTIIDGECQDDFVDSSTLPDYDESLVGRGDDPGVCFDAKRCFAEAVPVSTGEAGRDEEQPAPGGSDGHGEGETDDPTPDPGQRDASAPTPVDAGADQADFFQRNVTLDLGACAVNLNGAAADKLNLAIVTPETGECLRPNECYIPIDKGAGGWREENGRVQLPPFVCKLLNKPGLRLFAATSPCDAKQESNPICAETTLAEPPAVGQDEGGVSIGAEGLVVAEDHPTTVVATPNALVFAGATRVAFVPFFTGNQAPTPQQINGIPPGKSPWAISISPFRPEARLVNGGAIGWTLGEEASVITHDVGTARVLGATTLLGQDPGIYWAVNAAANGGVYRTIGAETSRVAFPGILNATAIVAVDNGGFLVGEPTGHVSVCGMGEVPTCGVRNALNDGQRVDEMAVSDFHKGSGYSIAGGGLYRSTLVSLDTGAISDTRVAGIGNTSGIQDGPEYFRRSLDVEGPCVAVTSDRGVELIQDLGGEMKPRVLVPAMPGKPYLGVSIGPALVHRNGDDAGRAVYWTVFAPLGEGGGIYSAPLPPECATARDVPDADSGAGGGAPEGGAMICREEGMACIDSMECCSKNCDGICFPAVQP